MTDRKPPRMVGASEKETLTTLIQYQRESVVRKLDGLDEDQARHTFLPSGTSLLWIVKHLARAELLWVVQRFAGTSTRALPAHELATDDTVDSVIRTYQTVWAEVDAIIEEARLDELCRDVGSETMVDLRWVLTHLLEETARHAGHADILREQIDGSTGR